jgi:hypothetical protein
MTMNNDNGSNSNSDDTDRPITTTLASSPAQLPLQFGDVKPSPQAQHELTWFFNEAERELDEPSAFCALVAGHTASTTEQAERRQEAMHAAGKINRRLQGLGVSDALMLSGLYTQRSWPPHLQRVLGRLAGAVVAYPTVRAQYLRALIGAQTRAKCVEAWLDALIEIGGPAAVEDWRREVQVACAVASHAYELARGEGESVVPGEGE